MEKVIFNDLRELSVLLAFNLQELLRPFQLTPEQYDTLLNLDSETGWRLGDLRKKVLIDNSKMTRIADYLEQQGWATRQPDPEDRRGQRLLLTEAGADHLATARAAHEAALQTWFAPLSESEKADLLYLLDALRISLRQHLGAPFMA